MEGAPTEVFTFSLDFIGAEDAAEVVKNVLSGSGSVRVDTRSNSLIIQDRSSNLAVARDLTKSLDRPTTLSAKDSPDMSIVPSGGDSAFSPPPPPQSAPPSVDYESAYEVEVTGSSRTTTRAGGGKKRPKRRRAASPEPRPDPAGLDLDGRDDDGDEISDVDFDVGGAYADDDFKAGESRSIDKSRLELLVHGAKGGVLIPRVGAELLYQQLLLPAGAQPRVLVQARKLRN